MSSNERASGSSAENNFYNIKVYYADEIEKCPAFGDSLQRYSKILESKKQIRAAFNEDVPEKIKEKLGEEVNGIPITEETLNHVEVIDKEYNEAYEECKHYMKQLSEGV